MCSCIEFGLSDEGIEYPSVQIRPLLFHEEGVGSFGSAHIDGAVDSLIAATALGDGLTLATKNRKHFQMIGDLRPEVPNY